MIFKVPYDDIEVLDPSLPLWQYMPVKYFKTLLEKSQLFFKRCDLYDDRNEGLISPAYADKIHCELQPPEIASAVIFMHDKDRSWHFASCWHENEIEASHMWTQYAKEDGVAIHTTAGMLKAALTDSKVIVMGKVNYVNLENHVPGDACVWKKILTKQKEYAAENEVRLLYRESNSGGIVNKNFHSKNESIDVGVNLDKMILKIVTSPHCKLEVCEEIYNLLKFYNLNQKLLMPSKMSGIR